MEYEYRELSEEKAERLNARKFVNMYGTVVLFDALGECVTTADERVVFTQIGYSHEDYIPNEFFINYNDWFFYAYMYRKFVGREKNSIGINYYVLNTIESIENATFDRPIEEAPTESEVLKILKEVLPVWNRNNCGRLNQGDQVITTGVEYKGVKV